MKIALKSNQKINIISAEYGGGVSGAIALTANREEIKGFEIFEEARVTERMVSCT